ncbi:MAG: signal peptidase II [Oscillospiraceae bacterium]|nr:signal peptidase II [Oscillospiraceae bacterium]
MLAFIFAALIVILDQFFKSWISRTLYIGIQDGPVIIPGVLGLTYWENDGAMLNILSGQQWLLAGIAFVAAVVLILIILRYNEGFWGTLGLASVLGGTVGNLVDRIFNDGAVIDMFRTLFITFPIFNIADIFITLGFITFLIHFISLSFKDKDREPVKNDYYDDDYDDEYNDGYDEFPEINSIVGADSEHDNMQSQYSQAEQYTPDSQYSESDYYAPDIDLALINDYDSTTDVTPDSSHSLYDLESEIGSLEDYNLDDISVDDLLREYGLDDD